MVDEWTEWLEHDGKGCPVKGMWVRVAKAEHRLIWEGRCQGGPSWEWQPGWNKIIRYRIRKPRALLQLIAMVENLPLPVKEDA